MVQGILRSERIIDLSFSCRSCGHVEPERVLSLGRTPLANSLLKSEQLTLPEPTYPLDVTFCPECALVQITEKIPTDKLFRQYLYFSSFSDTMLQHAERLVGRLIVQRELDRRSLVIEIGSNDGYLLQYYLKENIPVLGVDPAENVGRVAEQERGIPTLCESFGDELAQRLRTKGDRADIVHAHNVMAHVPDLNGFIRGMRLVLKDEGMAVIEVPYVRDLIESCEFDTIYHEHLCYFSLTSLDQLFRRHDLQIVDVERIPIHGGSLRLFVVPSGPSDMTPTGLSLLEEEAGLGMARISYYREFSHQVEQIRLSLRELLHGLKRSKKRIAAYGAAAKGSTLLNYCGIGRETLDFVVDRSPYKQGLYMPGVWLPIYSPEKLLEAMPNYVLLLTWNFANEILHQQAEYGRRGGHFIIPIPEPRII